MREGKVRTLSDESISIDSAYKGDRHIIYFREVKNEKTSPFTEKILFEDENILIIDKPHFIPIHPAGAFVKETLVHRLRRSQNNTQIAPINRIDRLTAGLVLMSKNEKIRKHYQSLFEKRQVQKILPCRFTQIPTNKESWHISNRIEAGDPWYTSQITDGKANSESKIQLIESNTVYAKFSLTPISGKHQLRLHMSSIGHPIVNDPLYPSVQNDLNDNYSKPLQLLAKNRHLSTH